MRESKIKNQLKELSSFIEKHDKLNKEVSLATVGWHLDHTTKVFYSICKSLFESDTKDYKFKLNQKRSVIWTIGFIPRGASKVPKAVAINEAANKLKQGENIAKCQALFEQLLTKDKKHFFVHPIFGSLNKRRTIWFLKLHTEHHLKIMRDILK